MFPDLSAARAFLREHLAAAPASEASRRYRYEHCLRVARIGRRVALESGLDADALELGCLLHDVGKYDAAVPVDHGRAGAFVVKEFFDGLDFRGEAAEEVVQGIAMHVDGSFNPREDGEGTGADARGRAYLTFTREPGLVARSIGDCDNVDRFSTYRIADTLRYVDFMGKSTGEQVAFIDSYLEGLRAQYNYECATKTAHELWITNLDYQWNFFTRLLAEITER